MVGDSGDESEYLEEIKIEPKRRVREERHYVPLRRTKRVKVDEDQEVEPEHEEKK